MSDILLIAGSGKLPLYFVKEAERQGIKVNVIGVVDSIEHELSERELFSGINIGSIAEIKRTIVSEKIKQVILLGKIEKSLIYQDIILDADFQEIISALPDRRDQTLLRGIINYIEDCGAVVMPQTYLLDKYIVRKKCYTRISPDESDSETISIGIEAAKLLTTIDVGQTVAAKNKSVVALEGIEGTDETITRAGKYAGKDVIIIKTARALQDMRMDVPTIGLKTIEMAESISAKGIVIETDRMLFLEQKESISFADKHNMFILGYYSGG